MSEIFGYNLSELEKGPEEEKKKEKEKEEEGDSPLSRDTPVDCPLL